MDYIDVRDIISRFEAGETEFGPLLEELAGNGGDEQWRGEWYPLTLVSERVWVDYVREMLEDCGYIPADLSSWIELDWKATARNVRVDYTPVDYNGTTYWYR